MHANISPIPRLHRNRQTPADSPLSQRSTASEHEVPLVYGRIHLQPQALEAPFLRFEIFKRYIERNVMERRLLRIQLYSLVTKQHCVRCFKEGEILCMSAIALCDFEEHEAVVPPGTAPCGQPLRVQILDADGNFT